MVVVAVRKTDASLRAVLSVSLSQMRVSLLVLLLAVSALCLVSATGSLLEAGSDVEWVQPSFIENEMELPGVGGACGSGGRCVALASPCSAGTSIVWSQCLAGVAKCCVPSRSAAPQPTPTPRPAPGPSTRPAVPAGGSVAAKVTAYITCLRSKLGIQYVVRTQTWTC
jgi:hypothetical protein